VLLVPMALINTRRKTGAIVTRERDGVWREHFDSDTALEQRHAPRVASARAGGSQARVMVRRLDGGVAREKRI
jgi:hypothetical protein